MRHLTKFDTYSDYDTLKNNLSVPYLVKVEEDNEVYGMNNTGIIDIEYLEGTGTQWITADCEPITKIIISCQGASNYVKQSRFFCVPAGTAGPNIYINGNGNYASASNSEWASGNNVVGSTRTLITFDIKGKTTTVEANGTTYTWSNSSTPNYSRGFILFASSTTGSQTLKGKIYYCRMYHDDKLMHELTPVRIGPSGYLFDKITNKLFGNAGTGNFTLGSDVDTTSHGKNLITNGFGNYYTNYNFSVFTFDSSDKVDGTTGSFSVITNASNSKSTDEYIPLKYNHTYTMEYYVKNSGSTLMYSVFRIYDYDKNETMSLNYTYVAGSTTYLTQDLKNGDTVVHLANVSGFKNTGNKGFMFWNYKNSTGYQYPPETYTRYQYTGLWDDTDTAKNTTNNTITLKTAWNKGTFPAGTYVSQHAGGGSYIYPGYSYTPAANTWVKKICTYNTGSLKACKVLSYIRFGWLVNYSNVSGNVTKFCGVKLTEHKNF